MIFNMTGYGLDTYTAVKEFEIGKILQWFWKKSSAHRGCIYLIKKAVKQ